MGWDGEPVHLHSPEHEREVLGFEVVLYQAGGAICGVRRQSDSDEQPKVVREAQFQWDGVGEGAPRFDKLLESRQSQCGDKLYLSADLALQREGAP